MSKSWKIIILIAVVIVVGSLVMCASPAKAGDVYVQGHTRSDGTYVAPHHRSSPDSNQYNNYGSQGNYSPYTGQQGNVQPQPNYAQPAPAYPAYNNNRGNSAIQPYGR